MRGEEASELLQVGESAPIWLKMVLPVLRAIASRWYGFYYRFPILREPLDRVLLRPQPWWVCRAENMRQHDLVLGGRFRLGLHPQCV